MNVSPLTTSTTSVDATRALAAGLAALAEPGDLVVLAGDLGAGKTAFVQGFAAALGVDEPVTSPTFTLANRYTSGRLVVNHLDVYRVDDLAEVRDLALPELLDDGVTVIEWGDLIVPALPPHRLDIRITFGPRDDDRELTFTAVGGGWDRRRDRLAALVGERVAR